MSEHYDLIVRRGTCALPGGMVQADLGVRGERIAALGDLGGATAEEEIDARHLHVLPGIVDSQVHLREPGHEHKEDLSTGTRAAVLGGVTAVFEMPNTHPNTTGGPELRDKLERARGRAWCDHAFYLGVTADNADDLGSLELLPGCAGAKIFMGSSTGTLLVEDDATLARALRSGRRRVAVHCEDEARLIERRPLAEAEGATVHQHPVWRDAETAVRASRRLLRLARAAGRRVHVLHVTTAEEMELLAGARDIATVEVTPQHLTLEAPDCYDRLGTLAQMNPPIREGRHREALWRGIQGGIADVIGSDHAPHTREEKAQPYPSSPSGMTGVQTLVPILLDHVHRGRLSLERFVDLTAGAAARVFGLAGKGRLALGYDADLTLVDLSAERVIEERWIASRCGWTPFDGMRVTGWPMATVIRGSAVMRDGQVQGEPAGRPLRFLECLPPEGVS